MKPHPLVSNMAEKNNHLEVPIPYMFGLFFRPKFQGISPQDMAWKMVLTYLHFRILEFPFNSVFLFFFPAINLHGLFWGSRIPRKPYVWLQKGSQYLELKTSSSRFSADIRRECVWKWWLHSTTWLFQCRTWLVGGLEQWNFMTFHWE